MTRSWRFSHLMKGNWHMKFVYLFSGALYICMRIQKACCLIKLHALDINAGKQVS
jgi:hypothetical protein